MTMLHGFDGLVLPELALRAGGDALATRATYADIDPCNGEAFGAIPIATESDVDAIVEAAHVALRRADWQDIMPLARERLLHQFADAI